MSQGKTKREFDRHSGSGYPIKGETKRSGGGKGNWGNEVDSETVSEEIDKLHEQVPANTTTTISNKNVEPETLAELNENDKNDAKNKSIDDYFAEKGVKKTDAYNIPQVKSQYHCKQLRLNKSQQETNKLFQGVHKKNKQKSKKKNQLLY